MNIYINNESFIVKDESICIANNQLIITAKSTSKLYKKLIEVKGTPFACMFDKVSMPFHADYNIGFDVTITFDLTNDGGDMTVELLNAIIHRWEMSNQFTAQYLRRSIETVKSYRYKRLPIPQEIADKMRRLHVFLATD